MCMSNKHSINNLPATVRENGIVDVPHNSMNITTVEMDNLLLLPNGQMKTWKQYVNDRAAKTAAEYNCSIKDVMECSYAWWSVWRDAATEWIRSGAIPSQAWINAARETNSEWWDRRICHDMPDQRDAMFKAGRSPLMNKNELL